MRDAIRAYYKDQFSVDPTVERIYLDSNGGVTSEAADAETVKYRI